MPTIHHRRMPISPPECSVNTHEELAVLRRRVSSILLDGVCILAIAVLLSGSWLN